MSEFDTKKLLLMEKNLEQKQRKLEEKKAHREEKNQFMKDIINMLKI